MSVHLSGDDILDAIFNKVQLVDVKFNGGPQPSPHTPSIAATKSLSQEHHSGEKILSDLTKAVESPADDCGAQEGAKPVAQYSLETQQQTNRLTKEVTEAQEICNDTGLVLSPTRQSSTNIGLDRQTNTSGGILELESLGREYYNQSSGGNIHFENETIESKHSRMVTPSPSVKQVEEKNKISPGLSHKNAELDLVVQKLNTQSSQTNLACMQTDDSEPETLDNTDDQLNLEEQELCEQIGSDKNTDHQLLDGMERQRGQKTEIQEDLTSTLCTTHTEKEAKKRPPKGLQPLKIKLNRDGDEEELRLDSPLSPAIYQNRNTPTEKYREIEVRTPLHESLSKAYSSFEPDRQELIRQEMGQTTSVHHLLHRFQHPQQQSTENGPELTSLEMNSYSKIQFQLPPINTQKVNRRKQTIVKTPHPVALGRHSRHPLQMFPEPEVVLEEQKSVSELLSKFGVGQRVKTRKVVAAAKMNEPPKVVLRKVEKASKPTSDYGSRHSEGMKEAFEAKANGDDQPAAPAYYTFWGGNRAVAKSNRLSEPPLGSLAAIQKSLSSVPNSPASSPLPLCRSPEPQAEVFEHFFGHYSPKKVRDFYRVWGNKPSNQGHMTNKVLNTLGGEDKNSKRILN